MVIVTNVTAINNRKQEAEFRKLDDERPDELYTVMRNGQLMTVNKTELVVGDLMEMTAGARRIPEPYVWCVTWWWGSVAQGEEIPVDGLYLYGDDPVVSNGE